MFYAPNILLRMFQEPTRIQKVLCVAVRAEPPALRRALSLAEAESAPYRLIILSVDSKAALTQLANLERALPLTGELANAAIMLQRYEWRNAFQWLSAHCGTRGYGGGSLGGFGPGRQRLSDLQRGGVLGRSSPVATFLTFCFCSEEPNYPELNPEFQSFQDMSKRSCKLSIDVGVDSDRVDESGCAASVKRYGQVGRGRQGVVGASWRRIAAAPVRVGRMFVTAQCSDPTSRVAALNFPYRGWATCISRLLKRGGVVAN
ncbi:hypothetical protein HPB47_000580 [Ixodes persulcatus]|uniref:Uncharacterized protein n=1 Tax=Ixodes persulcatus TaxID=34615 RepID=A0AC60PSZ1_IXOPE|nr:hypothetical protein HPB47_000580 [Ixodes persulcatus]